MDIQAIYTVLILVLLVTLYFLGVVLSKNQYDPITIEIEPVEDESEILRETVKALQNCRNDFNAACREYCVPREVMAKRLDARGVVKEYNRARNILSQSFGIEVPELVKELDVRA